MHAVSVGVVDNDRNGKRCALVVAQRGNKQNNKNENSAKTSNNNTCTLHPPSAEQNQIVIDLKNYNITVDAIAGSGKTTTILHIANAYKKKKILLLTYNSKLRSETKTRTQNRNKKQHDRQRTFHLKNSQRAARISLGSLDKS